MTLTADLVRRLLTIQDAYPFHIPSGCCFRFTPGQGGKHGQPSHCSEPVAWRGRWVDGAGKLRRCGPPPPAHWTVTRPGEWLRSRSQGQYPPPALRLV
jgi:hypothetical protein